MMVGDKLVYLTEEVSSVLILLEHQPLYDLRPSLAQLRLHHHICTGFLDVVLILIRTTEADL